MEQTCILFVNHPNNGIPKIINIYDNIIICLGDVCHESFEVWFKILMFEHLQLNCVHMKFCALASLNNLHVTNYNGHDFAISQIINMASHRCPIGDALDMVKHVLRVLQIAPGLDSSNEAHSSPNPIDEHLENEDLLIKILA
jgi:hypothetical protein